MTKDAFEKARENHHNDDEFMKHVKGTPKRRKRHTAAAEKAVTKPGLWTGTQGLEQEHREGVNNMIRAWLGKHGFGKDEMTPALAQWLHENEGQVDLTTREQNRLLQKKYQDW